MIQEEITTVYSVHGFAASVLVHKSTPILRDEIMDYCSDMASNTGIHDIIVKVYDLGFGMYIEVNELLLIK